ncbi:hypothetical protein PR202_gb02226 [Eleusine coracana subsp. coracana]|uniref:Sister chromatid cohesion 1 protein 1 n=1 Tax=Eleusine coracana subsp. coracana TaxID=191504 RepID=A0AAV5DZL0_ELECO|nr:hypothetical protein PR202_gb02226 [Eleusine coracana subsp. coracana]
MFYSHQLLARKAPLGQIWMAATLHSKINRKRLDKLDIIQICEEILNPSVPMALRLSGILMGGVVIVYERKVKLLYDDVSRLLIEINQVWRMKPATDPTVLPRGKAQAKYESVTLADRFMDMEVEQPMIFSEVDTSRFGEMVPSTLIPSPPRKENSPQQQEPYYAAPSPTQEEPQQVTNSSSAGGSLEEQEEQKLKQPSKPSKRKARRKLSQVIMDDNQTLIPGNIYQTWLKNASSLTSKRRKVNSNFNFIRSTKISDLMDMPPVALISYTDKSPSEFYYPEPLVQLWKECTEAKSAKASSSEGQPSSQDQQPRNSSPQEFAPQTEGEYERDMRSHQMDFTDGMEKLRGNMTGEYERAYDPLHSDHSVTPGSPGLSHRSASSSGGTGRGFIALDPETQLPSGRSKRRQHSSGRSLGNLDPVEEDFPLEQEVRDFKMRRLSDIGPTPDFLEETEPTQTPYEKQSNPIDEVTQSIQSHLKLHFDTPGAPQSESLSQLAYGMTKAGAARLFYQMNVLATFDYIKVTQMEPYGDIMISRGAKM